MDLLLVRHALPTRVVRDDGGPADPPLSDLGHRQAAAVADWLAAEPLTAVVTSPLRRARETAAHVAGRHRLPPLVVDGVAEYDADASAYVPMEELSSQELAAIVAEWADEQLLVPFQQRVVAAVREIVAAHAGGTVAVVCHGGVVNAMLGWVLGLSRFMVFEPTYASVTRIRTNGEVWTVRTVGEAGHLRSITNA